MTVFHALLEKPLDLLMGDPYERVLPGRRSLVKAYAAAMFGAGNFAEQWLPEITKDYAKKSNGTKPKDIISVADLVASLRKAFPALKLLESKKAPSWSKLMYAESVVVMQSAYASPHPSSGLVDGGSNSW